MLHSLSRSPFSFLISALLALLPLSSAERIIKSNSLNPCQANSSFSATLFNVAFTPDNRTLTFNIVGVSAIAGNVSIVAEVFIYGYKAITEKIDPCTQDALKGLCPMNTGSITIDSNYPDISKSVIKDIPNIAYTIPDLDAKIKVYINSTDTNEPLACVEAELSNGQTVDHKAVGWVTAVIAGIGLVASAITSGLGHSNTAAHVAANALSLFGFFQSQAMFGITAVSQPPIVASWTQNFQWSMGIIRVGFLQKMATWYQRSTGGTPTTYLSSLSTTSVEVQKRSINFGQLATRALGRVYSRSNSQATNAENQNRVVLRGIKRVGFRANIEITNIFFTAYAFFIIFVLLVIVCVVLFKFICEGLVKAGKMKSDKFTDFRNGWKTVLKGIMFRIILIGFPQMIVICFWELTVRDSAAEVVLAIFTVVVMLGILGWASSKVIRIAQRSIMMHKNPAYILYSDPIALNKWGFLYVQFKATAYYFIVPFLIYILIKGMFIGLAQGSGVTQAIALVLIEASFLVGISVLRPYMDKKTNGFNIAIAAVNFLSSIFILVFSNVFNQPGLATGIMGVIFFIYNAAFALVLLLMVLISSGFALFTKNPDTRYHPMRDDRGSFIKSQTQLTTELDALGATARGEGKGQHRSRTGIDDDVDSLSSDSIDRTHLATKEGTFGTEPPRSPINPSMPLFPSQGGSPPAAAPGAPPPTYYNRTNTASPVARVQSSHSTSGNSYQQYPQGGSIRSEAPSQPGAFRTQNNSSPWQRGAGYDH
ncbi:TRP-domain-containing protein [Lophium mytilinum]|uniref:TRP-domain-containing protein n=1 Tax=Lophium mytilinum TaxID=390894 RepID=A0A6A6RFV2_9PEZI|nr:TRP-domain-containing protein [Lophium mytilinum]